MQRRRRVLPAEVAAPAEDDLDAGVVAAGVVAEVDVAETVDPVVAPAGEGAGLLADVLLGVAAAGAEREELHQLARVVLVGAPLRVVPPVQPDEHGRVLRDVTRSVSKSPRALLAEERVLVEHPLLRADAGVRGREPVVPDERHPLDELLVRAHHAVEPPEVVVAPGVLGGERLAVVGRRGAAAEPRLGRMEEVVDRALQPLAGDARRLAGPRAEAGTPKQALGLFPPEPAVVNGHVCGHGLIIGGEREIASPFGVRVTSGRRIGGP